MYRVILQPENIQFDVSKDETILEAALNNNISFPNRCQVGACAACLCKKLSGTVRYQLEPLLTEQEQQQGWIFACQAYAESNLELTLE